MPPRGVKKGTKRLGVKGRSRMNKAQLSRAVSRKRS